MHPADNIARVFLTSFAKTPPPDSNRPALAVIKFGFISSPVGYLACATPLMTVEIEIIAQRNQ